MPDNLQNYVHPLKGCRIEAESPVRLCVQVCGGLAAIAGTKVDICTTAHSPKTSYANIFTGCSQQCNNFAAQL